MSHAPPVLLRRLLPEPGILTAAEALDGIELGERAPVDRVVPGDLLVMGGAGALHDGVSEPALLPEPVLAVAVEVCE